MKIETIPAYRIAYVRQTGPYGPANVQAMDKLKAWAASKGLLAAASIILGISHDNPETTLPENCRYDASIVISENELIDESVSEGKLSGGKYAIFQVHHTAEAIQQAWRNIFTELANNGYMLDDRRPIMERYLEEMLSQHDCEICIPIQ